MEKFLFLDLDDTVFQTRRKCSSLDQASPAAYNVSGEPNSYYLPKQKTLLALLHEQWRIIPTTARTQAAYARVNLSVPCRDGVILNHGATILDAKGQQDLQWQAYLAPKLAAIQNDFAQLKQVIEQYAAQSHLDLLVRIIHEAGIDFYVEVRHRQAIHAELHAVLAQCVRPLLQEFTAFQAYLNHNSLTLLPQCLNKSHAVDYRLSALRQQYGEILTMGMGDSLSDAPFMAQCDYALVPQGAQLHQQLVACCHA